MWQVLDNFQYKSKYNLKKEFIILRKNVCPPVNESLRAQLGRATCFILLTASPRKVESSLSIHTPHSLMGLWEFVD